MLAELHGLVGLPWLPPSLGTQSSWTRPALPELLGQWVKNFFVGHVDSVDGG